ncbi:MAG: polysaccharide biosynthesis protein [Candidatus Diapherotrites archaeon]|nr:polysaccharide biosynthesis protein [Candidatus Diapherotrites archaeon]
MKKICIPVSTGGHLKEMLQLKSFYSKYPHYFVTMERPDGIDLSKSEKVYFVSCPERNPIKAMMNFFQSLSIFIRENPDIVISTGADTALATCYLAKIFRKKLIYIESFCRPYKPSLTGKLVYPITDLFIYQWKALEKYYPKGKYGGSIF